ncbi:Helix-turn-helix domain protein [Mycobacterium marinum]|uniref:helix-turn-helix domain-containing protein n=1 Tax=Mycobacterium marinum TaxID=1781 RepID=UPI000E28BDFD|nr:helix-turn-helix domain-containing protein [Mycobacterium marinum]AXN43416.1 Helix-turn-helix domain protein [Mycobacterium marinum]RFZ11531.1 Helix-turn-helix domain protein [Mycobacterium marinum]
MTKLLYTRKEAAAALAMSERRLDLLVASGQIAAVRDGRKVKFTADELRRWIKQLPAHEPGAGI